VLHGSPLAVVTNKANSNTAIGTYSNFVLVSQGTLNATNYSFSFAPGTLSISAPILTLAALANFLGTNQLDTNELAFILTNNYAHPAVVYPGLLADFLGSTNLNRVDINDLNLFLNYYYSPTSDVPLATPAKDLRAPINMLDQAGLNVALAHYTGWPNGPSFTNLPPYLAAAGGGAGQTNYCFTITNFNFTVQFSSDLVHWTNLDLPGQIQFTDPNAPATPNGFYRLLNATGN